MKIIEVHEGLTTDQLLEQILKELQDIKKLLESARG